jgi:hypothetical protein
MSLKDKGIVTFSVGQKNNSSNPNYFEFFKPFKLKNISKGFEFFTSSQRT